MRHSAEVIRSHTASDRHLEISHSNLSWAIPSVNQSAHRTRSDNKSNHPSALPPATCHPRCQGPASALSEKLEKLVYQALLLIGTYRVVHALTGGQGPSAAQLARRLGCDKTNSSKIVCSLHSLLTTHSPFPKVPPIVHFLELHFEVGAVHRPTYRKRRSATLLSPISCDVPGDWPSLRSPHAGGLIK